MNKKREKLAVSETLGTILLLGITVALFSVVALLVLSYPFNPSPPTVNLIGMVDGNDIIIEHRGGEDLDLDTKILITIADQRVLINDKIPTAEDLLDDEAKKDNVWSIGEILNYSVGNIIGGTHVNPISPYEVSSSPLTITASDDPIEEITVAVVDRQSNSVIMMGTLQESGMTLPLDSVELWYRWSEEFWNDIFDNDDFYVSSYNNMDFSGENFVTVTSSGGAIDIEDYVDNDLSDVDGSLDKGSHSNFPAQKTGPNGVFDIITEEDVSEITKDFVDSDGSDVDGSSDKGSHSNFPAQQAGPDDVYDTLTEGGTIAGTNTITLVDQESFEGTWPPSGWSEYQSYSQWNKENNEVFDGSYSADFDYYGSGYLYSPIMDCSNANSISIDFYTYDDGADDGEYYLDFYDGSNWNEITRLDNVGEDSWYHYTTMITDSQYFKSNFQIRWRVGYLDYNEHVYIDLVTITKQINNYNYELDLELQWTDVNPGLTNELAIYCQDAINTHSLDNTNGYMRVGDGNVDWGSSAGTISFWIKLDSINGRPWGQHNYMETRFDDNKFKIDWGLNTPVIESNTNFIINKWYFIAVVWNENSDDLYLYIGDENNEPSLDKSIAWYYSLNRLEENYFMKSGSGYGDAVDGQGDELRYWNIDRSLAEIQSDYNKELIGSEANLVSYYNFNNNFDDLGHADNDGTGFDTYTFTSETPFADVSTENLQLDYWDGSNWQPIFSSITSGWNNASITSYLTGSTFTIRFKGTSESSDSIQDSWYIDASLIAMSYSSDYELDLEVQWTGITNYDLINEELCIYTSTLGSENLIVDVWDGSNWQPIFSSITSGWNNASITSYLTGSTFTIRYRDENQAGDSTQDLWQIDVALLHLWRPNAIYYQGNITSISITKDSTLSWDKFYADVDNPDSTFSILDESDNVLLFSLDGNGDDISPITSDTIRLFGSFNSLNPVKLDSWSVTVSTTGFLMWGDDSTSPWSWGFNFPEGKGYYKFYSIGKKSGYPDELPPTTYDTECKKI
jgi:hypothetical protein